MVNQESSQTGVLRVGDLQIRLILPGARPESPDRISFWWGVTSSSLALARFIESSNRFSNRGVLELGSGVGLGRLVAALKGARVTFTDYMDEALDTARQNTIINKAYDENVRFVNLDWEFPVPVGVFDIIIGSEIVYDYLTHSSLEKLIINALKPHGVIVIADRDRMVVNRFMGRLIQKGFSCHKTGVMISDPGFPLQEITIYVLERL